MITTATPDYDELALPYLLRQMTEDLKNPDCYYWLRSNYRNGGPFRHFAAHPPYGDTMVAGSAVP